jgi:hypothetical protein
MKKGRRKKPRSPEGKKISYLVKEGVPQKQAVAEALSMKRAGRLTSAGEYIRASSRKKSRRRSHKS